MDDRERPSPSDLHAGFRLGTPEEQHSAESLTKHLRRFLDAIAATKPDRQLLSALIDALACWTDRLRGNAGSEDKSLWRKAPRNQPPALSPAFTFTEDGERLDGTVSFGRFHVGRGAAHGGAVSLVFDEVMGALAASRDRPLSRTAFLHVDFRALTPLDRELTIRAWFEREEGRKRFLRATISDGDLICAEAHGLWVALTSLLPDA
jgi:acyl-coenzyme A thioesterase PaaI-like protein